ncbi:MAG: hypothetical protein ACXVI7_00605 [Halobacteriota archaeon]
MGKTMIQKNPKTSWMEPKTLKIDASEFVHQLAVAIGEFENGANVFIGPHVSTRSYYGGPIVIGRASNL